ALDNFNDYYDPEIKRRNVAPYQGRNGFSLHETDIRDRAGLENLFVRHHPDAVVHLAAMAGVRPSLEAPDLYFDVNVTGTLNILECMKRHEVSRLVFASSSSVYGGNKKVPFSEEDDVSYPVSPYAASKRAAEIMCYTYHHLYALDIFCLRFFTVYGPGQRPEMAIHKFVRRILNEKPIPVFGDGSSQRDYTYIDDIMDGVLKALDRCRGYRIYNLGESKTVKLSELIGLIEKTCGTAAKIDRLGDQPGDVPITFADISRAREELDYTPSVPVDEGLKRFLEWYHSGAVPGVEAS
ncbi:MAG: GDP-mannose 4,6-dehydratase, partial [Planctomycetes bacterium]|nr:GDP-mannose 4,6-dehydratase [Planctomycetota bacterium]